MAQKTTRSKSGNRKTTSKPKKPGRKSTPASSKSNRSRSPRSTRSGATQTAQSTQDEMSLDRKLDIAGIVLALIGLLTLLIMVSPIRSSVTEGWMSLLGMVFGVGAYLFPFVMLGVGIWLVLRKFERIPPLEIDRLLGFTLLFIVLLASAHFVYNKFVQPETDIFRIALDGLGGGYLGAAIIAALSSAFGIGGTAIALIAALIIALILAFNVTVWDMVGWIPPYLTSLQDWFIEKSAELRNHRQQAQGKPAYYPEYPATGQPDSLATEPIVTQPAGFLVPQPGSPLRDWVLPPIDQILDTGRTIQRDESAEKDRARVIEETLASFGAPAKVVDTSPGPTITQFGVEPQYIESRSGRTRVRVSKIASLADDLALALSARTIRIQAPVPGKGYIGIEVPNDEISLVALRDVIESEAFKRLKSPLRFALGQNVAGNAMAADLSVMPHLLIAGATGSGKSVCVNALICCLLMHNTPDTLRMVMVDPKRVELTGYNGVPHLLAPVVVELEKVVTALQWILREMDMRYQKLAEAGCRNIKEYNTRITTQGGVKLPYLVVVIDELADLMMLAPDDTERSITRLAQLARATGIHMVIATQRPSVDVVTGLIKANLPARIAFAVASGVDSRVILDQPGAERLLGRGDMLFQSPDAPAPIRLQGVFVSDNEIFSLVNYWRALAGYAQSSSMAADGTPDGSPFGLPLKQMAFWEEDLNDEPDDPLYDEAVDLVRRQGRASISMLQRRLRIGYTRSARLIEAMEDKGIVGEPHPGTGTREVLDYGPTAPPVDS